MTSKLGLIIIIIIIQGGEFFRATIMAEGFRQDARSLRELMSEEKDEGNSAQSNWLSSSAPPLQAFRISSAQPIPSNSPQDEVAGVLRTRNLTRVIPQSPSSFSRDVLLARGILGCLLLCGVAIFTAQALAPSQSEKGRLPVAQKLTSSVAHWEHFNALRFPATVWVIAFHFGAWNAEWSPWQNFLFKGRWAVTVFLILSGFTTHHSWQSSRKSAAFLVRRLTRVCLAYYASLAIMMFLKFGPCWEWKAAPVKPLDVAREALMLQTWPLPVHGWGEKLHLINGPGWFVASSMFCWITHPAWGAMVSCMSLRSVWCSLVIGACICPIAFMTVAMRYGSATCTLQSLAIPDDLHFFMLSCPPLCLIKFLLGYFIGRISQQQHQEWQQLERETNREEDEEEEVIASTASPSAAEPCSSPGSRYSATSLLADASFSFAVLYVFGIGGSSNQCSPMYQWDGSFSSWFAHECIAPVLFVTWALVTTMPRAMKHPGYIAQLLESRVLTSRLLCQPTLMMFLMQYPVAWLLNRANLLPSHVQLMASEDTYNLSFMYVGLIVLTTWLASWLWCVCCEDPIMRGVTKALGPTFYE